MQLDRYIKVEQTRALYERFAFVLIGTAGISILTVGVLWNNFSKRSLLLWLFVSLGLVFIRWITCKQYSSTKVTKDNYQDALTKFLIWAFISGLTWGLVPIFFFDHLNPVYALFITCVYTGYIASVASSTALYLPVFLSFSIIPTVLFAGRVFQAGGDIYTPMSVMILFYYVMTLSVAKNTYKAFLKSITLNHENLALLAEVSKQKDAAEAAINAKNQFLAAASHDLRQPLHAMGLFIDTLKPTKLDLEQTQIIEKIGQSKQALNDLLHGLLDISRLDAGVVENKPVNYSLEQLLEKLQAEFAPDAEVKGVQLTITDSVAPVVFVDPVLLERILRNVVDNAIKYTDSGSINLSAHIEDNQVILTLSDTGIGIDEANTEKVFSEFHQLNNPERDRQKGLGLGLAIVKRLCALTGVKITFNSTSGVGTCITFGIPLGSTN
ncbi:MAG: HAMP domain-containing sensor histidine kinase, partial [Arenicellales bacterium]